MYKFLFILLYALCFGSTMTQAQRWTWSVTAEASLDKPKNAHGVFTSNYKPRWGGSLGVKTTCALGENASHWFGEASLLLANRGWIDRNFAVGDDKQTDWKLKANYLELPLRLGYRFAHNERMSFKLCAGPYVAVGLWGGDKAGSMTNHDLFTADKYKRFDWGLSGYGSIVYQRWEIGLGYSAALSNPAGDSWKLMKAKDKRIILSLSYCLN